MKNVWKRYQAEALTTFQIGLPIVVGQLGLMAAGVADTIQVGAIPLRGTASVAAAGVANGLFFTICIIALNAMGVIAPMISKADAEGEIEHINRLFRAAVRTSLVLSLLTAALAMGAYFALDYMGQDAEVTVLAKPFFIIMVISGIPMLLFVALRQLSDGLGKTNLAMWITISSVALNILLNWLLIYGIGGFPRLELVGAGIATLIARLYMVGGLWWLIRRDAAFRPYLQKANGNLWALVTPILKTGLPAGFQGFFEIGVFNVALFIIGQQGKYQQAAHLIAINMCSVTYMMSTGIAVAGGIRVGHFWGLKDRDMIRLSGNTAIGLSTLFMALCALLFFTCNAWLVGLYTQDPLVIPTAMALLIIGGWFQLSDGIQATALGLLRGIADVNVPTVVTLFAYWVVGLPLGYYLCFTMNLQAAGIWYGLTAGLTVSAILLCWRFFRTVRQLKMKDDVANSNETLLDDTDK
jgi:multidrug resistance protein, MATE family